MNSRIFFGVTCWFALVTFDSVTAQEKYPGGIVYGPKAAFNIGAPEGWLGVVADLFCCLAEANDVATKSATANADTLFALRGRFVFIK